MATAAKTPTAPVNGEYQRPDAEAAFKIYDNEIKPKKAHISTLTGDLSDPHSRIKDKCHFPRQILDFITALEGMEDAKRDHHLLALSEGMKVRELFLPRDLATMAQGTDGDAIVPAKPRAKPKLVATSTPSDGSETDLATAAGGEFEMSQAELAQQRDRPAAGTGAAALAAMKAAQPKPETTAEPPVPGDAEAEPAA